MALIGSQSVPAHRLGIVLGDALAEGVTDPEVVLRFGVTLLSFPPQCVEIVLCLECSDGEAARHNCEGRG